uniref:Uncharacterized protein n=1 Tax=Aegilops tauschii TaxID=37682 RepID=M8CCP6_AEGTA
MSSLSSVGGGVQEEVTQEWMVSEQLRAYKLKQSQKKLRLERDSKEFAEKEKQRRDADGANGAKFVKVKQPALQKKRLSSVAEEGGTPRRNPRVAGMNKNLVKQFKVFVSGDENLLDAKLV